MELWKIIFSVEGRKKESINRNLGEEAAGPPQREGEEKEYGLVGEMGRLWKNGCWTRKRRRAGSEGTVTLKWDKQIANCGKRRTL